MRIILLTIAALAAAPAAAETYGTADGGCERAAGNPVNDVDAYFDGKTLGGQDWWCDLTPTGAGKYTGACGGDAGDEPATVTFTMTTEGDTVTITSDADDQAFVMQLCR